MGNPDPIANAIKELTKEIKKQNKFLENLTEAIEKSNCNYIYKITPTNAPVPLDPITNPPYTFTCDCETGPYYGTKVNTTDWTYADSSEVVS